MIQTRIHDRRRLIKEDFLSQWHNGAHIATGEYRGKRGRLTSQKIVEAENFAQRLPPPVHDGVGIGRGHATHATHAACASSAAAIARHSAASAPVAAGRPARRYQ